MKKTLIAGAATLVFAVTPVFSVFATGDPEVTDSLTVTISPLCSFSRTSSGTNAVSDGAYTATMLANAFDAAFGVSSFTAYCNNGHGYTITPTFTSLTFSGATDPVTYSTTTPAAGSGTWTAVYDPDGNTPTNLTDSTAFVTALGPDSANRTFTVTYKVGLLANQPEGTYVGTATYSLAQTS